MRRMERIVIGKGRQIRSRTRRGSELENSEKGWQHMYESIIYHWVVKQFYYPKTKTSFMAPNYNFPIPLAVADLGGEHRGPVPPPPPSLPCLALYLANISIYMPSTWP